jgi:hypothetical protein
VNRIERKLWEGGIFLAAATAGLLARQGLGLLWRETQGEEPPENPAATGVTWADALGWAVASGIAIGVGHVLARRGATAAFRAVADEDPPDV